MVSKRWLLLRCDSRTQFVAKSVNATTFCLIVGGMMTIFGVSFGVYRWVEGSLTGQFQSAGTVALSLLPTIISLQLLLQRLVLDVVDLPRLPLSQLLGARRSRADRLQSNPGQLRSAD